MPISVVSFSSSGGAGNVARALVEGFSEIGLDAQFTSVLKRDLRAEPFSRPLLTLSAAMDEYLYKSSKWSSLVSLARDRRSAQVGKLPPAELTIFRWMNGILGGRFISENPFLGNLVWGLDDMNPFTGVCHYSGDCIGFSHSCERCPAIRKPFRFMAVDNLDDKIRFAERHNPIYVAPSDWINEEFRNSRLSQTRPSVKILNPLQSRFFQDFHTETPDLPHLRLLIVSANLDDRTKGIWDIVDELQRLLNNHKVKLTMIGRYSKKLASTIPNARFLGSVGSSRVMFEMREHDALIVPSLFENAGTVISEAASQGLPSIARRVGGMPEMTSFGQTGYLFQNNEELRGILDSLTKIDLLQKGDLGRQWAQGLKPQIIATQYAEAFL